MFNYYEIEISSKYVKNLFSDIIKNKINMYNKIIINNLMRISVRLLRELGFSRRL